MQISNIDVRCLSLMFFAAVLSPIASGETLSQSAIGADDAPQLAVDLSAGVALPQTLPGGTAMTFSVDYRITSGTIHQANKYGWVLKPSKGEAFIKPVELSTQGTLQAIVPQLKPSQRPFTCHIIEVTPKGKTRKLCPDEPMK